MAKITQIQKRTGAIVPFNEERISNAIYRAAVAVGGRDRETASRLARQVTTMVEASTDEGAIPTVEDIQNVVEKVLIRNDHAQTAKAYILYRDERARKRQVRAGREVRANENIPWRKIWEVLDWAVAHDLHTVEHLNERIARGEYADIVRESDRAYCEDISTAAEMIRERKDEVRIAIIAGPSSSGKTTTTTKLGHMLQQMGLSLVPLTVDNYFYDLALHPKDEHGDYDYEAPQALDLELVNQHLIQLLDSKRVMLPFYDFQTGKQHRDQTPMQIGPNDVILIDSLHGLFGPMTEGIPRERMFKLYIEPLLQMKDAQGEYIRWTDLRLMRRMERDASHRNHPRQRTLEHWHYVRSSELRNIIPYVNATDYVVNSGLPYELPVMKNRLYSQFCEWVELYRHDPLREDAAMRSERVYRMLSGITAVEDESSIPPDSLLREFIGGSCYEY